MKILVCSTNLFRAVGGGQSYYQQLAKMSKNEFVTFHTTGPVKTPSNVRSIELKAGFRGLDRSTIPDVLSPSGKTLPIAHDESIALYFDMAEAVAGHYFDVIEIPDFLPFAALIPAIFKRKNIKFGKLTVGMHGTLFDALVNNWGIDDTPALRLLDEFDEYLYRVADIRLGMGRWYTQRWRKRTNLETTLINPLEVYGGFVDANGPIDRRSDRPKLAFVGRHDLVKGPDLFVEICCRLRPSSYSTAIIYGNAVDNNGVNSKAGLVRQAEFAGLDLEFTSLPFETLMRVLQKSGHAVIHPARQETFNLAAFEALVLGNPIAVSTMSGVNDFLGELDDPIHLSLDISNFQEMVAKTQDWLDNYTANESMIRKRIGDIRGIKYGVSIEKALAQKANADVDAIGQMEELVADIDDSLRSKFGQRIIHVVTDRETQGTGLCASIIQSEVRIPKAEDDYGGWRLLNKDASEKPMPVGRADSVLSELENYVRGRWRRDALQLAARMEEKRGRPAVSACYKAREARLAQFSGVTADQLKSLCDTISDLGWKEEAVAIELMSSRAADLHDWIEARLNFMGSKVSENPAVVTRIGNAAKTPKLSVICSVFNGTREIPSFINNLSQTLIDANCSFEVYFMDSQSTDGSRDLLIKQIKRLNKSILKSGEFVVMTTERRESIQAAWNRGLSLVKGEFVCLPGLDEAYMPGKIDILISELENNPDVNWLQGDTVVYDVDDKGNPIRQLMPYKRRGANEFDAIIESTVISFVGSVIRRSLFTKAGLFDDSFKGAGDTDFKMRNIQHIKMKSIDEVTGCFLNFPTERVTSSHNAEIEDIRAWYAYRTAPALSKNLEQLSTPRLVNMIAKATKYQKSFTDHMSSDWLLAGELIACVEARADFDELHSDQKSLVAAAKEISTAFRKLYQMQFGAAGEEAALNEQSSWIGHLVTGCSLWPASEPKPVIDWYRDNCQEQHCVIWEGRTSVTEIEPQTGYEQTAGIQNAAELLSACGSKSTMVNFSDAWKLGHTSQILKLQPRDGFDVSIPFGEGRDLRNVADIDRFLKRFRELEPSRSVLFFGDYSEDAINLIQTRDNVYFTGRILHFGPLFLATTIVAAPFEKVSPATHSLLALAEKYSVPTQVLAIPKAGTSIADPYNQLAEIVSAALPSRLTPTVSEPFRRGEELWSPTVRKVNWVLRRRLEQGIIDKEDKIWLRENQKKPILRNIVASLLVKRDALILSDFPDLRECVEAFGEFADVEKALNHILADTATPEKSQMESAAG